MKSLVCELQATWQDPPHYRQMRVFWAVAKALMERFDRAVCSARRHGVVVPVLPEERVLVDRNARRVLSAMNRLMLFGCFEQQAWKAARRDVQHWPMKEWERLADTCPSVVGLIEDEMGRQ